MEHRFFVSHNRADKDFARRLSAALTLAGAQVWFDDWVIKPGDSIPFEIDKGLAGFDAFLLLWSAGAAGSRWVQLERDAAIARWANGDSYHFVPVRLDATPLPKIISSIKSVDATDGDHLRTARELLGLESESDFRRAVQEVIDESGLEFREFYGAGVYVCCPKCGLPAVKLEQWSATDFQRDDEYAGVRCPECGWEDGGEI